VVSVLLEVTVRLFDPLGVSYYPETARYFDTLIKEEPIGYRNRPGLDERFYGVPVHINALGMRDRDVPEKPPGEFRLLVLGDSVPFGIGVRYEDSFPHQLELLLSARHPRRRFRTLNMGVPSYNTEQELIQLRSSGLALRPDAVMLLFSSNDIEPKLWVFQKRDRWYVDLVQRSYAGSFLFTLFRAVRQRWAPAVVATAHAAAAVPEASGVALYEYRADSPRWQAVDRSLSAIHAALRARRIPFVLFTNDELPFIVDMLDAVARREGFPLVNLRRRDDPRWAGQDERLFRNSATDGHPSPLGNRALATLMAEHLERLKIVAGR
jgi:lysophospholipase L1-like esterase